MKNFGKLKAIGRKQKKTKYDVGPIALL